MKELAVGVPLFSKEALETVAIGLYNIRRCFNELGFNPPLMIAVNGPDAESKIQELSYLDPEAIWIKSLPGVAGATRTLARKCINEGQQQIIVTDIDIYRFPHSFKCLVEAFQTTPQFLVYGNYAAYPLEVLEKAGIQLTEEEKNLWHIFQADKHPLVRPYVREQRSRRFKSSLVMGNCNQFLDGLSCQNLTTDSVISSRIEKKRQVESSCYMHYGRTDLVDFILARFRHIKAAVLENRFNTTYYRQEVLYTPKEVQQIADIILAKYPESDEHQIAVSYFLLQAALRYTIYEIGKHLFLYNNPKVLESFTKINNESIIPNISNLRIRTFSHAVETIRILIGEIKDQINPFSPVVNGVGVTQIEQRGIIDVEKLIEAHPELKSIVHGWLGISFDMQI